jgi:hypothetical protein
MPLIKDPEIPLMKSVMNDKAARGGDSGSDIFTVKMLAEVFSLIPYTIDTRGFEYKKNYYTITAGTYIPGIEFSAGIMKNSIITLYRDEEQQPPPEQLENFLQIPENLPESIEHLAKILGQNALSRQEILYNIQAYLAAYYTYNLDPPVNKKTGDFLENFLFQTKEGYCTHFATAFTILARLNKIPVRYVSGYLVYITDDSFKKTVTARTAHAWPEVWLPDKGWYIWESTQAVNRNYYETSMESMYYRYMFDSMIDGNEIARNNLTLNQLRDLLGLDIKLEEKKKGKNTAWHMPLSPAIVSILVIFLAVCTAGGILYLFIRFLLNRRPKRYWKVLLNRIVASFRYVPLPEEKGWIHWKNNICTFYKIEQERADALVAAILRLAYSQKPVTDKEITLLKRFKP